MAGSCQVHCPLFRRSHRITCFPRRSHCGESSQTNTACEGIPSRGTHSPAAQPTSQVGGLVSAISEQHGEDSVNTKHPAIGSPVTATDSRWMLLRRPLLAVRQPAQSTGGRPGEPRRGVASRGRPGNGTLLQIRMINVIAFA